MKYEDIVTKSDALEVSFKCLGGKNIVILLMMIIVSNDDIIINYEIMIYMYICMCFQWTQSVIAM